MKPILHFPWTRRDWTASMAAALAALTLAACGGGVGTGGTGGNATAYAAGPITGFGSVIVGGVRFDDSAAAIEDGDGARRSRDELRLGMTVEVDSSAISSDSSGSRANASRIRFESELLGLVGVVDVAGGSFMLLGQRVTVDDSTVFDERLAGGLAGLATGLAVEVYAVFDVAAQRYRATRIEPAALSLGLRLRGQLAAVDSAAQTLRVGATSYSFAGAVGVPAGLAAGQFVRLRLELDPLPTPRWVVRSFGTALQTLPDADELKAEGLISAFVSTASFSVNGRPVDASGAAFPDGTVGLATGVRVEVEGAVRAGVLRATKVSIKSDAQVRDRGFEITGAITAVNATARTFTVRGVTVSTARPGLEFDKGTAADLAIGRNVEVRGVLGADRRTVEATRIRFL
jgi:Domain of unknown function (DUF5666)